MSRRNIPACKILSFFAMAFLASGGAFAQGPSFDCAKATTADELTICADPWLSGLEWIYAESFARARESVHKDQARQLAKSAMAQRRGCGDETRCIARVLTSATDQLNAMIVSSGGSPAVVGGLEIEGMPATVGGCLTTRISGIRGRLGTANFENGTEVTFESGGFLVSYGREPAVIASSVGDPVRVCLISIPDNCLGGDIRGRTFRTTNLATEQSWTMANSQHMCGGA